ncbi:hypothetical protein CmeUKMEL1_10760 [Cryptosporidium meleagridis]|uniref:Cyclin family protein n=1 Tax=Cryptosporidium meleagridis TaxID=93969 RepID=A0A2P4Z268_9CRYT|nr:hypothetical protein CmeUKMEL1_10760 [Cryptosporidium meleagridis]
MTELEDSHNEISSHEWESNLAKIICGSLLSLNELIEDISDEDLHKRLSDQSMFCIFECFFEPLLYYKNKHNLPPNLPKLSDESIEGQFVLENPLYSESENKDLSELFRFGKTPKASIQELFGFVLSVLHLGGFNVSSFVLSVINVVKFVEKIKIPICQHNWRPIFITSLILSDKLWDDSCAKSGDLARTIGFISPKSLKYLELIFCEELDWKITFKLDTIKCFISKIVNSKLDPELIQKVISSETYQSYCYEGIHDPNTQAKHDTCVEEKLENKNMMNSVHSSDLININKQKIGQKFNQNMNNYPKKSESPLFFDNQNPRMPPSMLQQPQLQRRVSLYSNHLSFNAQSASSAFFNNLNLNSNTTATLAPNAMRNQIGAPINLNGTHQHQIGYLSSNMKRPSVSTMMHAGGSSKLNNRSFYSPARNQMNINQNNNNFAHGSSLSLNHIANLTSPKSDFMNKTQKYPIPSTMGQTPISKASTSGRSYTSENLPSVGSHAKSTTPDVNASSVGNFSHFNVSLSNERGRDTSCLSKLKQPIPSHVNTSMNSNLNTFEKKLNNHSRQINFIKRSSSEHSRLNPANFQASQHNPQQPSRPLHPPQIIKGGREGGEGAGFFSMARNKVSSAFSSITRTFGLSSPLSNQINENSNQRSNISPANLNQINPTNNLNTIEPKSALFDQPPTSPPLPQKIDPNSNQHFNQQNKLQEYSHQNSSNKRNFSMPPKSNPVFSQLSENKQKSPLLSSIGISNSPSTSATKPNSGIEKKPPLTYGECHLRSLSTDRAYNVNHPSLRQNLVSNAYPQAVKNGISNSNHLPEKKPTFPSLIPLAPNSSSIRTPQNSFHNPSPVSDSLTANMHAALEPRSLGRGPSQIRNTPVHNSSPSINNGFFGKTPGMGAGLTRNMSLVGKSVHSQKNSTGEGLLSSFFGAKSRMQSSCPSSNSTNTGLKPTLSQLNNSNGSNSLSSSIFSMDSFINPIGNLLKGKKQSVVSSSIGTKAPGTQTGSLPISGIGLSFRR